MVGYRRGSNNIRTGSDRGDMAEDVKNACVRYKEGFVAGVLFNYPGRMRVSLSCGDSGWMTDFGSLLAELGCPVEVEYIPKEPGSRKKDKWRIRIPRDHAKVLRERIREAGGHHHLLERR